MTSHPLLAEPGRVDEPQAAHDYSDVLSRVARDGQPVIVRRNGTDLAAVIPLEHLELIREILSRQDVERLAAAIDWDQAARRLPPAPEWFEGDEPKPF